MKLCVDASLAMKWLTYESGSQGAIAWLAAHVDDELMAPTFFTVEIASVLRQKVRRAEINAQEGREALDLLRRLNIKLVWDWSLLERAYEMAVELSQSTVYDTAYLALAEREQGELWTADASFARTASQRYQVVRVLP